MHRTLSIAVAALLFAGHASAAETLRIESEDQFNRDYGHLVERHAAGVYQFVAGPLAGKTVTLGKAGLLHDLAALRAQVPTRAQERVFLKQRILRLERSLARIAKFEAGIGGDTMRKTSSATFPCAYVSPTTNRTIRYSAAATAVATTEYYLSNGAGGLNTYYGRASATAAGSVARPSGVPLGSGVVSTFALAWNHNTGVLVQRSGYGSSSSVSTGYVYSGPAFSHNLDASSTVEGEGDCVGYLSIDDHLN
jgi:hypothetical protein